MAGLCLARWLIAERHAQPILDLPGQLLDARQHATLGAAQQFGPAGASMSRSAFYAYLGVTATMARDTETFSMRSSTFLRNMLGQESGTCGSS